MLSKVELEQVLKSNGVDTASLSVLSDKGGETIYGLVIGGEAAVPLWKILRGLVEQTGFWPVILGDSESLKLHVDSIDHEWGIPVSEIIEAGLQIDAGYWLHDEYVDNFEFDSDEEEEEEESIIGEWPESATPNNTFTIPFKMDYSADHSAEALTPLPEVHIGLVPTKIGWEVAAYLRFGGWNACPWPREHVAVMKRWYDLFGAEPVGITHDTIEMQVAAPPQDRESAMELAQEQAGYCDDIVYQGWDTVSALAASLFKGTVWFFWWD